MPPALNQFYDRTYVISLKHREDRRQRIAQELRDHDIDFEFFDAVIGADLSSKELAEVYDAKGAACHPTGARELSPGEIGCTLSHLHLYRQLLDSRHNRVLILEDDAVVSRKGMNEIPACHDELPDEWDLLYYGCCCSGRTPAFRKSKMAIYYALHLLTGKPTYQSRYRSMQRSTQRPHSSRLRRATFQYGTHAYGITRSGAELILSHNPKVITAADCMIGLAVVQQGLEAYITRDHIFTQDEAVASSIVHT